MTYDHWNIVSSVLLGLAAGASADWLIALIDALNYWYAREFRTGADASDSTRMPNLDWMRWWWAGVLAIALILGVGLRMPLVAAVVTALLLVMPRAILAWLRDARKTKLRNQLVIAARSLASQFRAGLPLPEGLRNISRDTPRPLSTELRRCVDEYSAGTTIYDALTSLKNRLDIDAVTLFVVSLLACERRGGKVTEAMDTISQSLEELQRIEQKKESVTAGGRALVIVLAMFPAIFAGLFGMIDPKSLLLLMSTVNGQIVLCIVIVLTYVSVRWAFHIIASIE